MRHRILAVVLAAACAACSTKIPVPAASAVTSGACSATVTTKDLGNAHIANGARTTYPTFPPASGPHDPVPLPAGIYDKPLSLDPSGSGTNSLFRAVHSLEHGYVIVFYSGLSGDQVRSLRDALAFEKKVIVAPARQLDTKVALVAWRRVQSCTSLDLDAVKAFIAAFREKTAPEPGAM